MMSKEMVWYDDGHVIHLELHKSEVVVTTVMCPNGGDHPCRANKKIGCIVQFFVGRFGLECNVGVCPAEPEIRVAWAAVGDTSDVDLCQVWIVPVTDDLYAAWATTMRA